MILQFLKNFLWYSLLHRAQLDGNNSQNRKLNDNYVELLRVVSPVMADWQIPGQFNEFFAVCTTIQGVKAFRQSGRYLEK